MPLEKVQEHFPEDFDQTLYKFYQKRLELGEDAYLEFVDGMESDIYTLERAEIILKYQLPHSWTIEDIESFYQSAFELADINQLPQTIQDFEASQKALENEKNKPIEYPKRYEANFTKGKKYAIEAYLAKSMEEKEESQKILSDILLAIENRRNALPAPAGLSEFNFRGWQESDYQLLHDELKDFFDHPEKLDSKEIENYRIEKEREETRKKAQEVTNIEGLRELTSETVKPKITDAVLLSRNFLDGKTLEEELTGGAENLPRPYNVRSVLSELTNSNQLLSEEIQNTLKESFSDEEKYQKFLRSLQDTIVSIDNQSSAYAKNRGNESVISIIMVNVTEKKRDFIQSSGLPHDLALQALVDALYRLAIKVRNPQLNPANPAPEQPQNGLQKSLTQLHRMLAQELYDSMFIDDFSELKFVNAIGTPLDFSANCDCFFTFGDYVIPVDITANSEKASTVSKYDETYLFIDTSEDKANRRGLNAHNARDINAYAQSLTSLTSTAFRKFVLDVRTKLDLIRKKAPIPGYKGLNRSQNIGKLF